MFRGSNTIENYGASESITQHLLYYRLRETILPSPKKEILLFHG